MDGEFKKGGIAMRVTSIQPIEYLKIHLAYDDIAARLLKPLTSTARKIRDLTDQSSIMVGLVLDVLLFITAFMRVLKVEFLLASYSDAVGSILPPMIVLL